MSFAFTWVVGLVAAHRDQFPINFQKYSLNNLEFTANVRCGLDIDANFYIRQKPFWFLRKFWDVDCSTCLLVFWCALTGNCLALATLAKDNVFIPSSVKKKKKT